MQQNANARCRKRITIDPNSEYILWGKLPTSIIHGLQCVCTCSSQLLSKGLLVCKTIVTVSKDRTVPLKILNAGHNPIVIPKGFILATFSPVTEEFQVQTVNSVNNVNIVQNVDVFKQSKL